MEEVAAVRGVDVEEDAGDDDRLLLEELLEEGEAVVERRGQLLEVEPDVERRDGRDGDVQPELVEPLEDVVALRFEVLLERDLLFVHALGLEEGDRGELEAVEALVDLVRDVVHRGKTGVARRTGGWLRRQGKTQTGRAQ